MGRRVHISHPPHPPWESGIPDRHKASRDDTPLAEKETRTGEGTRLHRSSAGIHSDTKVAPVGLDVVRISGCTDRTILWIRDLLRDTPSDHTR